MWTIIDLYCTACLWDSSHSTSTVWNESRWRCTGAQTANSLCVCTPGMRLAERLADGSEEHWVDRPHDWYADRIWGAACRPPSRTPLWPGTTFRIWKRGWLQRREVRGEWKSAERRGWVSAVEILKNETKASTGSENRSPPAEGYYSEEMRITTSESEYCSGED